MAHTPAPASTRFTPCTQPAQAKAVNFHGGAIIDAQGNEIPITEDMVRQALQQMAQQPRYRTR